MSILGALFGRRKHASNRDKEGRYAKAPGSPSHRASRTGRVAPVATASQITPFDTDARKAHATQELRDAQARMFAAKSEVARIERANSAYYGGWTAPIQAVPAPAVSASEPRHRMAAARSK